MPAYALDTFFAHVLDCSIVPPRTDWGSAAIGLSPQGRDAWNSLAHALLNSQWKYSEIWSEVLNIHLEILVNGV